VSDLTGDLRRDPLPAGDIAWYRTVLHTKCVEQFSDSIGVAVGHDPFGAAD